MSRKSRRRKKQVAKMRAIQARLKENSNREEIEEMTTNEMNMIAGVDCGNGFTKAKVQTTSGADAHTPERVNLPSCVAYTPVGYKWTPAEPTDDYMEDLVNVLDCEIKTPVIPETDKRRMLVGERAATLSTSLRQFDLDDHIPKCDNPLSIQLILSVVAAQAVKTYWNENGEQLPEASLQVTVDAGLALPFTDFINHRDEYRNKLMGYKHVVHVLNFESPITVNISFDTVSVLAEGQAAQYALSALGSQFLDAALDIARESSFEVDAEVDGEFLVGAENLVGIDIGCGNVSFPVFAGGKIQPNNSASINVGFGNGVLDHVVEATRGTAYELDTRKDLERIVFNEPRTAGQRKLKEQLELMMSDEIDTFARDIVAEYKRVIAPMKMDLEVVYIYGGGADAMKEALRERLMEASEIAPGAYLTIVPLDSSFSRDLNRNGLYQVAQLAHDNK